MVKEIHSRVQQEFKDIRTILLRQASNKSSSDYQFHCKDYRYATVKLVEYLNLGLFKSQREMGRFLEFSANSMNRHVRCGRIFDFITKEDLQSFDLDELSVKILVRSASPELNVFTLAKNKVACLETLKRYQLSHNDILDKTEKIVFNVKTVITDSSIDRDLRWSIYSRINDIARIEFPENFTKLDFIVGKLPNSDD
jgi:hypothetical protein